MARTSAQTAPPFFAGTVPLKTRLANAQRGRAVTDAGGPLVLVGGYIGPGETVFARFLCDLRCRAFLDKDALTRRAERLRPEGDRHDLYRTEVQPI